MAYYGVWFKGRNTPKVVQATTRAMAISRARRSGTAGSGKGVVSARRLKGTALRQAKAGRWVRQRADGKSPRKSRYGKGRGYGPPRSKRRRS